MQTDQLVLVDARTLAYALKEPGNTAPVAAYREAWTECGDGAPCELRDAFNYLGRTFYYVRPDQLFIVVTHWKVQS